MVLISPTIIAPDSSHWSKWIDAALSRDAARRAKARGFHERLLEAGRIPLLSWHHLEELLGIDDAACARDRVAFIQSLPMVAYMRLPWDEVGLGGITDILTAEAISALSTRGDAVTVRDAAKRMLLRTGTGSEAIGDEGWVWEVVRPHFRERRKKAKMVMAVTGFRSFDDERTIGEIAKGTIRDPSNAARRASEIREGLLTTIRNRGDRQIEDPEGMADMFMAEVLALEPPPGISVRELVTHALKSQGVDEEEIRDDRLLSELNALAKFRTKLRIVAPNTGKSFEELKAVEMERLPSWLVERALQRHGQVRNERKGSDLNDGYLAVWAAYTDQIYVDKRVAEDFRRALAKESSIVPLIGMVSKAPHYVDLAG
jgi:hypothetical protein